MHVFMTKPLFIMVFEVRQSRPLVLLHGTNGIRPDIPEDLLGVASVPRVSFDGNTFSTPTNPILAFVAQRSSLGAILNWKAMEGLRYGKRKVSARTLTDASLQAL